jgi:hypothetical protein
VEFAFAGSLGLVILGGLMFLQSVVFHYHHVSALAHEGARWASVRGKDFEDRFDKVVTSADILENAIRPRAQQMDLKRLSCSAVWDESKTHVKVTVKYQMVTLGWMGPMPISCTSHMLVSY